MPAEGKLLAESQHPLLELLVSLANKHFPSIAPALAQLREFGPESNASENVHTDWGSPLPSAKTPECPSWQKMIIPALVSLQLAETVPSLLTNSCKSRDFHPVCRQSQGPVSALHCRGRSTRVFVLMESPLYLFLGDNLGLIFFSPTEEVTQKLHRVESDFTALAVSLTFTLDLITPRNK